MLVETNPFSAHEPGSKAQPESRLLNPPFQKTKLYKHLVRKGSNRLNEIGIFKTLYFFSRSPVHRLYITNQWECGRTRQTKRRWKTTRDN